MSLKDRVALVTGASRGIGAATAEVLARRGAQVAVSARTVSDLDQVAGRIRNVGGQALVVPCDVLEQAQVEAMVERVVKKWGRLDILINNAGLGTPAKPVETIPPAGLGPDRRSEPQDRLPLRPRRRPDHEAPELRSHRQCLVLRRPKLQPDLRSPVQRRQGGHPRPHQAHGGGARPLRHQRQLRGAQRRAHGPRQGQVGGPPRGGAAKHPRPASRCAGWPSPRRWPRSSPSSPRTTPAMSTGSASTSTAVATWCDAGLPSVCDGTPGARSAAPIAAPANLRSRRPARCRPGLTPRGVLYILRPARACARCQTLYRRAPYTIRTHEGGGRHHGDAQH